MKSQDWELSHHEMPIHKASVKIPLMKERDQARSPIDSKVLKDLNRASFRHHIAAYCNVFCNPFHRTHAESACDPPKEKLIIKRPVPDQDQINLRGKKIKSNKTCEKLTIEKRPRRRRECFVDSSSSEEEIDSTDITTEEDIRSHISAETLNDDSLYKAIIASRNLRKEDEDARADLKKYKKMRKLWTSCKITDREKRVKKKTTDLKAKRQQLLQDTKENDKYVASLMIKRAKLQQEMDEIIYEHRNKRLELHNTAIGKPSFDDPSSREKHSTHFSDLWKKRNGKLPPLPSVYERTYNRHHKMLERKLDYFQGEIDKHKEEIDYLLCGRQRPADESHKLHFVNIYVPKYDNFTAAEKISFLTKSGMILDAKKKAILCRISTLKKLREQVSMDWQQGGLLDEGTESEISPGPSSTAAQDSDKTKAPNENHTMLWRMPMI